jgi:hypothetical protein
MRLSLLLKQQVCWLLILLPMLFTNACRRVPTGATVSFVNEPAPGLITVAATGRGIGLPAIERDAVRTALETLLFVGLPASVSARQAMVDPTTVPTNFLNQFVERGSYQPFISGLDRSESRRRRASGGGKTIRYVLTINQQTLRQHLEQQGVIRKFGY